MIKRLYIHNFRCFENFELSLEGKPSTLLIGKNGAGKSTIRNALAILQSIARGSNRVGSLVKPRDFFLARPDGPMRLEIDVVLQERLHQYRIALELPAGFRELRVQGEQYLVDGKVVYSRESNRIALTKGVREANFLMDWHMIALPIIQEDSEYDDLLVFKLWLARSILLSPIPSIISGESEAETLEPEQDGRNLGAWFSGTIAYAPSAYAVVSDYLKSVLQDFWDVKNPLVGAETRTLLVRFRDELKSVSLPFAALSDGEKCFFICALILAAKQTYGPVLCFWDEPDSHLSLDEVSRFMLALRRDFEVSGQMIVTSHNPETIRRFELDNTLFMFRRSHLEPTRAKWLDSLDVRGDIVNALILGDIDP